MSIFTKACKVLNLPVDSKNPHWFYQKIQENQEHDGTEEFLLQRLIFKNQLGRLSMPAYKQKLRGC
jgi:hypothetical protein